MAYIDKLVEIRTFYKRLFQRALIQPHEANYGIASFEIRWHVRRYHLRD